MLATFCRTQNRGAKGHISMRNLHSCPKAEHKGFQNPRFVRGPCARGYRVPMGVMIAASICVAEIVFLCFQHLWNSENSYSRYLQLKFQQDVVQI